MLSLEIIVGLILSTNLVFSIRRRHNTERNPEAFLSARGPCLVQNKAGMAGRAQESKPNKTALLTVTGTIPAHHSTV